MQLSKTRSSIAPRRVRPLAMDSKEITVAAVNQLATKFGIVFDHATVLQQVKLLNESSAGAMDSSFVAPATVGSLPTPIQFLQTWLPGFIKVMTAARKIDDIVGVKTVGSWEDQEIVQGIVEPAATATEYGDFTNIPLANWNTNFIKRTIVRGELGMESVCSKKAAALQCVCRRRKRSAKARLSVWKSSATPSVSMAGTAVTTRLTAS